jgi:hypothetical protein
MRRASHEWRIEDILVVAMRFNLRVRRPGGGHVVITFPHGLGDITIPARRPIKPVYIRRFVACIDAMREEE